MEFYRVCEAARHGGLWPSLPTILKCFQTIDMYMRFPNGRTPIDEYVIGVPSSQRTVPVMSLLLNRGLDPDYLVLGHVPLVYWFPAETIRLLVKHGADINATGVENSLTVAGCAFRDQRYNLCLDLVEMGAHPSHPDHSRIPHLVLAHPGFCEDLGYLIAEMVMS